MVKVKDLELSRSSSTTWNYLAQAQQLGIISLKLNNLDATNKETESDSRILYSGSTESTHPAERACLEMQKSTSQVLRSREEIEEDLRNKIEKSTLV
jgi:hypothetical protein